MCSSSRYRFSLLSRVRVPRLVERDLHFDMASAAGLPQHLYRGG